MGPDDVDTSKMNANPLSEIVVLRRKLVRRRATVKAKITNHFALMSADDSEVNISNCKMIIEQFLKEIKDFDYQINDLWDDFSEDDIPDELSSELNKQSNYLIEVRNKLSQYSQTIPSNKSVSANNNSVSDCKLKLPDLKCGTFSGEGASHMEFHTFISQFNNVIGLRTNLTDATKLTYLRSYLKGYAFKLVQHLQIVDSNYDIARNLLYSEFLNENSLVNDLITKLLDLKPKYDQTYLETKIFLGEVRCLISDLNIYINMIS